jgi:hypothetical protein
LHWFSRRVTRLIRKATTFSGALLAKDLDLSLGARNRCEGHFANCSSNFGIGVRNYLRATSRIAGENRVV